MPRARGPIRSPHDAAPPTAAASGRARGWPASSSDREPRLNGRDFEQHAARLAEINRLEVAAIADLGDLAAVPAAASSRSRSCSSPVATRHRDVVHGAEAVDRAAQRQVVRRCRSCCPGVSPPTATRMRRPLSLDDVKPSSAGHQLERRRRSRTISVTLCRPRIAMSAVETVGRSTASARSRSVATSSNTSPDGSANADRRLAEPRLDVRDRDPARRQPRRARTATTPAGTENDVIVTWPAPFCRPARRGPCTERLSRSCRACRARRRNRSDRRDGCRS